MREVDCSRFTRKVKSHIFSLKRRADRYVDSTISAVANFCTTAQESPKFLEMTCAAISLSSRKNQFFTKVYRSIPILFLFHLASCINWDTVNQSFCLFEWFTSIDLHLNPVSLSKACLFDHDTSAQGCCIETRLSQLFNFSNRSKESLSYFYFMR